MASKMRWLPLESNPEIMNKYASNLGVTTSEWQFVDIFGLDPDLLMMVPRPVLSVLLLYPTSEKTKANPLGTVEEGASGVFYMKQTIGNACGTVAIIHALANSTNKINLAADKPLAQFIAKSKDLNPEEKAKALENEAGISACHESIAQEGQTEAPSRDDEVKLHFVAFVHANGNLYELDGRKPGPTCHGKTTPDSLLEDTVAVVRNFMNRDPDNLNFTLVALAKTD